MLFVCIRTVCTNIIQFTFCMEPLKGFVNSWKRYKVITLIPIRTYPTTAEGMFVLPPAVVIYLLVKTKPFQDYGLI